MLLLFVGKNGKSFCQRLIDYQYTGLSFDTMTKASAWLQQQRQDLNIPSAIICDLQLPDGNAFDLRRQTHLNEEFSDVIFIVVAKNFISADKERATELGIDAYFSYPPIGMVLHQSIDTIHRTKQSKKKQSPEEEHAKSFLGLLRNLVVSRRS